MHKKNYDIKYKYVGGKYIKIKEWHDNDGIPLSVPAAEPQVNEISQRKSLKK